MTSIKDSFLLQKDITFLNFGSFGSCPKPVFERYQQLQLELEQEPVTFMLKKGPAYLLASRMALGKYINCAAEDLVYVTNPSYAVNIVGKNLPFKPDDEILTTDLEYGACDKAFSYYCEKMGLKLVRRSLSFPFTSKEQFVNHFLEGITPKTKMIFISHITSATALKLPVEEIVAYAKQKGILTFVDGAHAPGQIPVDMEALDADFYTGACHKWMMAPKGSSFLYVKKEWQHLLDPLVVSWGYNSAQTSGSLFLDYHEMQGTRDTSAFCAVPAAIQFMEQHNWVAISEQCKKLSMENAYRFCTLLSAEPIAAIDSDFCTQMYSSRVKSNYNNMELNQMMMQQHKIQIPFMLQGDEMYIRYSVQAFNNQQDLDRLYQALEVMKEANLIL